jgi:hypothetical protein
MKRLRSRKKLVAASAALALVGGGGAAIAASDSRPSPSSFLDSVAEHLGISREELDDATRAAAIDQVDAALEAGRITEEEAERLKERIDSGKVPAWFGPWFHAPRPDSGSAFDFRFEFGLGDRGGHGASATLSTAAEYLGLNLDELGDRLEEGETLGEIAKAEDKTVDGLVDALLAEARERLDEAVESGRLDEPERADEILERLESVIRDFVENGFRGIDGLHGPPFVPAPEHAGAGSL